MAIEITFLVEAYLTIFALDGESRSVRSFVLRVNQGIIKSFVTLFTIEFQSSDTVLLKNMVLKARFACK